MAIDTKSLSQLITEFRALQSKDSVSPDSLGYILQRIADLLATAGTSDTVTKIQQLLDGFKAAGYAITSIKQGQSDRNHVYATIGKVSLSDGKTSSTSEIFIQQATTERAGAMRAQQVTDLNAARKGVTDLKSQCQTLENALLEMQKALGIGDGTAVTNVVNTAQITCQVVDGELHILGAQKLIAAGYVPYLFRNIRKRNQYHHKPKYRTEANADRRYCSPSKGWHVYGSRHVVKITGTTVLFATDKSALHQEVTSFLPSASALFRVHTRKDGKHSVGWGRSTVLLEERRKQTRHRMLRFRFAIGFAKKIDHGTIAITPANLVSSLAEFTVVYDPKTQMWSFSR